MNVFIRTDASCLIGSGHVMRCLTLADMFKNDGNTIEFICRDLPGNLIQLVQEKGYVCNILPFSDQQKYDYSNIELNDNYEDWRGVPIKIDYSQTQEILKEKECDLLVIDHYGIGEEWEIHLRSYAKRIMVIDDLANRKHDCDILLDHNFYLDYESRYDELVSNNCLKLLGPGHALINPELKKVKQKRVELAKSLNPNKIENVLIFLGGMDAKNYTDAVIQKALSSESTKGSALNVVLGKNNPHKEKLKCKYAKFDNVVFHVQPSYYYDLLGQANLAIGAGGVSVLERNFIKLWAINHCVAENQSKMLSHLQATGYNSMEHGINMDIKNGYKFLDVRMIDIHSIKGGIYV